MTINTSNRYFTLLLVTLFMGSILLKIYFVDNLSLWVDEAYTVWFTKREWYELWFWVPTFESHPPFYYSLMKIWGSVFGGMDGISYRYASIFLSSGLLYFSYLTLKKLIEYLDLEKNSTYLVSSLLFLFSPFLFWYSLEARPYILFCLCYSVAIYSST